MKRPEAMRCAVLLVGVITIGVASAAPSKVLAGRVAQLSAITTQTNSLLGVGAAANSNGDAPNELAAETMERLGPLVELVRSFHDDIQADLVKHENEEQELRGDDKRELDDLYKEREVARGAVEDNDERARILKETKTAQLERIDGYNEDLSRAQRMLQTHIDQCLAKEPERVTRLAHAKEDLALVKQLLIRLSIITGEDGVSSPEDLIEASNNAATAAAAAANENASMALGNLSAADGDVSSGASGALDMMSPVAAIQKAMSTTGALSATSKLDLQSLLGVGAAASSSSGYDISRMSRMIHRFEKELTATVDKETSDLNALRKHCDQSEYSYRLEISNARELVLVTNSSLNQLDIEAAEVDARTPQLASLLAATKLNYDEKFSATQRRVTVALTLRRGFQHVLEVSREVLAVVKRYEDAYTAANVALPDMSDD